MRGCKSVERERKNAARKLRIEIDERRILSYTIIYMDSEQRQESQDRIDRKTRSQFVEKRLFVSRTRELTAPSG